LILTNKRVSTVVLVPIFAKGEDFRDSYKKTARFSVMILILLIMPSSYSLDAESSRGRSRVFSAGGDANSTADPRKQSTPQ
jgi:hypothetical protein